MKYAELRVGGKVVRPFSIEQIRAMTREERRKRWACGMITEAEMVQAVGEGSPELFPPSVPRGVAACSDAGRHLFRRFKGGVS